MLLLPCSRGRAGAWVVKRAASTCYRPGVRPFDQRRRGARSRRPSKTFHTSRNARLDDLIIAEVPRLTIHTPRPRVSALRPTPSSISNAGGYGPRFRRDDVEYVVRPW